MSCGRGGSTQRTGSADDAVTENDIDTFRLMKRRTHVYVCGHYMLEE